MMDIVIDILSNIDILSIIKKIAICKEIEQIYGQNTVIIPKRMQPVPGDQYLGEGITRIQQGFLLRLLLLRIMDRQDRLDIVSPVT